jgi:osmotically-inducible protein OsmY
MRTDNEIERDVKDELRWDPEIDDSDIATSVRQGVVTLAGFVKSWSDKYEAEAAVKRVAGVRGIANDLEVRLPTSDQRPDPDIAREAVAAIKTQLYQVADDIRVVVKNGWLTLEGNVEWQFQKSRAEAAVRRLKGVRSVTNSIAVKPRIAPSEIKRKIEEAFKRSAEIDADRITVEASDSEVILKGTVRSWAERQEAEHAAWAAPGVRRVENRIEVNP